MDRAKSISTVVFLSSFMLEHFVWNQLESWHMEPFDKVHTGLMEQKTRNRRVEIVFERGNEIIAYSTPTPTSFSCQPLLFSFICMKNSCPQHRECTKPL